MARNVDYIAPMVYPSLWVSGEYQVQDPPRMPYEIVTRIGARLGLNPTRLRWRLLRGQERWRRLRRRVEQKVDHVRYAHKTCPA